MPLLNEQELRNMRLADPDRCGDCGREIWKNYCRQCDEFFWVGHEVMCPRVEISANPRPGCDAHITHRTY